MGCAVLHDDMRALFLHRLHQISLLGMRFGAKSLGIRVGVILHYLVKGVSILGGRPVRG